MTTLLSSRYAENKLECNPKQWETDVNENKQIKG